MKNRELSIIVSAILTRNKYFICRADMLKYMFELAGVIEEKLEVEKNGRRNSGN